MRRTWRPANASASSRYARAISRQASKQYRRRTAAMRASAEPVPITESHAHRRGRAPTLDCPHPPEGGSRNTRGVAPTQLGPSLTAVKVGHFPYRYSRSSGLADLPVSCLLSLLPILLATFCLCPVASCPQTQSAATSLAHQRGAPALRAGRHHARGTAQEAAAVSHGMTRALPFLEPSDGDARLLLP